jgi:hypothetical protein
MIATSRRRSPPRRRARSESAPASGGTKTHAVATTVAIAARMPVCDCGASRSRIDGTTIARIAASWNWMPSQRALSAA